MNDYYNKIKNNPEALLHFFEHMPKGGDIHHHALGALWAEDIMKYAAEQDFWIESESGQLFKTETENCLNVKKELDKEAFREFCIKKWSVAHFDPNDNNGHSHFFDVFPKIAPAFIGFENYWLERIADQARKEGLIYIETMIECPSESERVWNLGLLYDNEISENADISVFEAFYCFLKENGLQDAVKNTVTLLEAWKKSAEKAAEVELCFQLYAVRNLDPRQVLAQLILCYEAAAISKHVVGVNLVAPEYHENTLKFYSMQMRACRWLNSLFPQVNLALHAGELSKDIVEESHLKFHIDEAVSIAKAKRIGHGVDLHWEHHRNRILDFMSEKGWAIEILPKSNDFILNISGDEHPFETYLRSGVPVIVATDDPGLLRCTLADQYLFLAQHYSFLDYDDFRQFSLNSIKYSFLPKIKKEQLLLKLTEDLGIFEKSILGN